MAKTTTEKACDDILARVRGEVETRVRKVTSFLPDPLPVGQMLPGKMLRSRLGARLLASGTSENELTVQAVCVATELLHTASLCHDDVVDDATIRRSAPTLWRNVGSSGAILVGDLLLCESMNLLLEIEDGRLMKQFLAKVTEVVETEAHQELVYRGKQVDVETCFQLARGKTGPLFAFIARICGDENETLCGLLEEAGYRIGTAYQLSDDLLDVLGDESTVGKTLGTDVIRGKFTLPRIGNTPEHTTRESIGELCNSAVELLDDYPKAREGLSEFLRYDLQPAMEQTLGVETGT